MELPGIGGLLQDYFRRQKYADEGLAVGGVIATLQYVNQGRRLLIELPGLESESAEEPILRKAWTSILLWGEFGAYTRMATETLLLRLDGSADTWSLSMNRRSAIQVLHEQFPLPVLLYGSRLLVTTDGKPVTRLTSEEPSPNLLLQLRRLKESKAGATVKMNEFAGRLFRELMLEMARAAASASGGPSVTAAKLDALVDVSGRATTCAALLASDTLLVTADIMLAAWTIAVEEHGKALYDLSTQHKVEVQPPHDLPF